DHTAGVRDPCRHDLPGILRRDESERGRALEPRKHGERCLIERAALRELILEEMHRDLGIGLAGKAMAFRDEWRLEHLEVLDDPVVDHRGHPAAVDVRMRVLLARPTMGRPARVTDPGVPRGWMGRDYRGEVVELAFGAEDLERPVFLHRDARRVVAAVLQAPQATHEERQRLTWTDVADDPTHLDELLLGDTGQHLRGARRDGGVLGLDRDPQDRLGAGRPDEETARRSERCFGASLCGAEGIVLFPLTAPRGLHVARHLWP